MIKNIVLLVLVVVLFLWLPHLLWKRHKQEDENQEKTTEGSENEN